MYSTFQTHSNRNNTVYQTLSFFFNQQLISSIQYKYLILTISAIPTWPYVDEVEELENDDFEENNEKFEEKVIVPKVRMCFNNSDEMFEYYKTYGK